MTDNEGQENRLIAERRAKLAKLREAGVAFPNDFKRSELAGELVAAFKSHSAESLAAKPTTVAVSGRMMVKRVTGAITFVKIQDRSGQIQLLVRRDRVGEPLYAEFKKWDIGDVLGARGELIKTKTGELSVDVAELRLLTKSLRPLPEKWHGIADQEFKLRQRYVDLIMSEETREVFRKRSALMRFVRGFLDALDFTEVETPMMQPIPGGAAARPFVTHHNALDATLYLRIAPELYLKRLLVGGFERVYELGRVFRNEGLSTRHNPEFTMLELYQAYATQRDIMALTENLFRNAALALTGEMAFDYQGERIDFGPRFAEVTIEGALQAANPELKADNVRDRAVLASVCATKGIEVHAESGAGKLQFELFEKTVEPTLRGPVFVTQYPAEVSPLARCNDGDPFLTDRFELFITGRELANGFSELNDPEEQAARFRAQADAKAHGDEEAMFYDADYIRALEYGMPPAGGLGVGIDRLAMLLTNSASIRDVLLFPQLKPET
ncbi:MAG TPA: lysine--tRNA ligase [Gammaproteobacteria bacterium]|nr:lysine--tRNA ligase [Gammaproteobacteria bacterium]